MERDKDYQDFHGAIICFINQFFVVSNKRFKTQDSSA